MRFAVQAEVSVGGLPAPGCSGRSHIVLAVTTPSDALKRLLPAGCGFERVDARAYRIVGRRPTAMAAAPAAKGSDTPLTAQLTELIVTAEKRREPLRGSPFAVSVLTGGDIDRLGARSFADAATQFPGVAETNLGPGRDKIFIRGISDGAFTGRTQATVGLYLDEVPITYNAPDPDLRLADIEQVEVLRGPQGTLYGSGSIGGIVRMVTARPETNRFRASVDVEGSFNGRGDRSTGLVLMLNAPIVRGRVAVRGVAYRDTLSGYLDNPTLGLEDVNRSRRKGGRAAFLADLPDGWRVEANLAQQSIRTTDSQYVQGANHFSRDTRIREPHANDFSLAGVSLAHSGSWADVRASVAFIDHDLTTRYEATGAFDLAPDQTAAFDENQGVGLWVAELLATSSGAGPAHWLGGAFGALALENSSGVLDASLSGGPVRSVFVRRDKLTEAAVYGELSYNITPQLVATAGGRIFATRVESQSDGFGLGPPGLAAVRAHLTDEGFAPKFRLSYAPRPDTVVYAQMQNGYRAGGFNVPSEADGAAGGASVASFRPDHLRSYELGGEMSLFARTLTLRAAVFRADWRNVQTDQFRPSGLPVTLNIGDGANTGLEAEAVWRPDAHWRFRFNALVSEPQLTRSHNIFPARVDVGLPGVAKITGALDLSYSRQLFGGLDGELAAQAAYIGRSYLTFDGAAASAMGGYGQGRISATLRSADWRVQAFVANVTDEGGNTFAFGNPFSQARLSQATPLAPRTFGLAITRGF